MQSVCKSRALASLQLLLISLALATQIDARKDAGIPEPPPFADPKHDPYNPLRYIPSDILTGISLGLYLVVTTALGGMMWKFGAKWMLCVVIGGYTMSIGLAMRFPFAKNPHSSTIYIIEYLFVVLSPCAFIAGNYILLGRLSLHLNAGQHLLVRATRVTRFFIASDIITFLIQATGGSMSTSHKVAIAQTGAHIFLAGLALQLASFLFFTCVFVFFLYKVQIFEPEIWTQSKTLGRGWFNDWRTLAGAMVISCFGILLRSVYRTVELSQGYVGHLATTEKYFYGLDTFPLLLAIAVYVPFWPGRFLPSVSPTRVATDEETAIDSAANDSLEDKAEDKTDRDLRL